MLCLSVRQRSMTRAKRQNQNLTILTLGVKSVTPHTRIVLKQKIGYLDFLEPALM